MSRVPALILTPVARDAAVARLQDHYAKNHLELHELEARLEEVEHAKTTAELEAAFAGLPALDGASAGALERSGQVTKSFRATLSSTAHRGRWKVPSRLEVRALLGSVELDLFDAEIDRDVDIEVRATLGSVRIVVPDDVAVDTDGRALLGSFAVVSQGGRDDGKARRVRIRGRALLGSVEVVVKARERGGGLVAVVKKLLS